MTQNRVPQVIISHTTTSEFIDKKKIVLEGFSLKRGVGIVFDIDMKGRSRIQPRLMFYGKGYTELGLIYFDTLFPVDMIPQGYAFDALELLSEGTHEFGIGSILAHYLKTLTISYIPADDRDYIEYLAEFPNGYTLGTKNAMFDDGLPQSQYLNWKRKKKSKVK